MTDEPRDQQDPILADALAVPPLDDVTRRRLVKGALDGVADSPPPAREKRSWAPLVAAAVVILLVVAGIVALSRGGDGSSSDTAARRPDRAAAAPEASAADSNGAAASVVAGVTAYGDLGDLSTASARAAARTEVGSTDVPAGAADIPESLLVRIGAAECAASLRTSGTTIRGVGTATVDGNDAAVVVTEAADGTRTAHLLVFSPCSLQDL